MAAMPRPTSEFERVCLPLLPECRAFALTLTRNATEADDLVQETFLKALRSFEGFQRGTNAKAWLFTVLRRLHIDRYRRARRSDDVIGMYFRGPVVPLVIVNSTGASVVS